MTPSALPDNRPPWPWGQFGLAVALFPLSFLLWFIGLDDVFRPQHNPIAGLCLIVGPFVGIAGAIWIVFLVVRRNTTGKKRAWLIVTGLTLAAFGLFLGIAAFFSPTGQEGEAHVLAVLSGILLIGALACAYFAWQAVPDARAAKLPKG